MDSKLPRQKTSPVHRRQICHRRRCLHVQIHHAAISGAEQGHLCLRLHTLLHLVLYHDTYPRHTKIAGALLQTDDDASQKGVWEIARDAANPHGWSCHLTLMCATNVIGRKIVIYQPESANSRSVQNDTVAYSPIKPNLHQAIDSHIPLLLAWAHSCEPAAWKTKHMSSPAHSHPTTLCA